MTIEQMKKNIEQAEQFKADFLSMKARDVAKKYDKDELWVYAYAKNLGIKRPRRKRTGGSPFKGTTPRGKVILHLMVEWEMSMTELAEKTGLIGTNIAAALRNVRPFSDTQWERVLNAFSIFKGSEDYDRFFEL